MAASTIGGLRTGSLVVQESVGPREAKSVSKRMLRLEDCDNLINSLKLVTSQQKDGDSPAEIIVTGLLEKSRNSVMDGLRKFIEVDNHEAVNVGGLRRGIQLARWEGQVSGLVTLKRSSEKERAT